ncbi:16S rRNA (adenine(1518)-N(6)/adenine(1519)-N(6))-dimethyltransferase RsmA [Acidithiobacillus montserratensis]|uniref:16S rRNA (Adenine(1518)-N(6)/adenine(1519)-N(6))-dimethyltransferase RsmA n=1 Tax=Acidithiobacillus montserratensis TaxID=2729135 RepID=A0ACD5HFV8_9PROT|nr:16S rRNA (adenine(1518)-N(6)/adenine(1519)-N(6))-dimethyltransferase RsmA [Acidithiobacillus montserratensis]MBN2680052.1 16S rRNA (adenine(1518)-N(6)/adenine(1519)-N(6))-dimethyltransferase RsmA [Acidithiobacillaceae bacterium]MBU2749075.1 16S rRNA (adenine(1518)-N(6)/adenine(1519)-N(6))-dimethyltransferase RsmA [Acidithiobacillus montserratensis]
MQVAALPPAKKRFGQNFLVQPAMVERIMAAIRPQPRDFLVEIGPGPGALTRRLLPTLAHLTVIELDRDMIPTLENLAAPEQLTVVQADALKVDFARLGESDKPLRVVGNLPYNVATPIIFHILESAGRIQDMHFMLQKEVVDRMVAAPGSKTYGRLSVMIQASCQVESLFTVAPGNFYPVPKVDSAFMRLLPYQPALLQEPQRTAFAQIVARSFAQRRKTMANNLRGIFSAEQLRALDIDPTCRAETLDQAAFFRLAEAFAKQGSQA